MVLQASRFYIRDFFYNLSIRPFFFCYHRLDLPSIISFVYSVFISGIFLQSDHTAVFLLLSSTGFTVHYFLRLHTSFYTRTLIHRISSCHGLFSTFYHQRSPHLIDYDWKNVYFFCCCLYSRRYFIRPSVSTKPLLMNCYFTGFLHFTDSPSFIFILPATSVT